MANLLYLVHRLPYPPNKGDKVRSYHILKHLASRHRVFLGTFVDDAQDERHVETVAAMCTSLCAVRLRPAVARLASAAALLTGEPLTVRYYGDRRLHEWVAEVASRERLDAAFVFSSSMAQYTNGLPRLPTIVDFVDVDSAKWLEYANARRGPAAWLYRREGELLLAHERAAAARARRSLFVTEGEAAEFRRLAPECSDSVEALGNGVDSDYFSADPARSSPFTNAAGRETPAPLPVVFTGAMDYWPNIDAVSWFVREILPALVKRHPGVHFHIVGRNPAGSVEALASPAVSVTGTVPDVRPFLQHAAVVVAPLRLARGVQNKVLEAMAMGRPVVASASCARAIDAKAGAELVSAESADDFVREIGSLLDDAARADAIGRAGRARVLQRYGWAANLMGIDRPLADIERTGAVA